MATFAEQRAPEPMPRVPECTYIIRKGEAPDFDRRSNILPWQEALAGRSDKWAPLTDETGKFMKDLPPMIPGIPVPTRLKDVAPPVVDKVDMVQTKMFEVFRNLDPDDFKPNGVPKLDVVRECAENPELTNAELKELWNEFQKVEV